VLLPLTRQRRRVAVVAMRNATSHEYGSTDGGDGDEEEAGAKRRYEKTAKTLQRRSVWASCLTGKRANAWVLGLVAFLGTSLLFSTGCLLSRCNVRQKNGLQPEESANTATHKDAKGAPAYVLPFTPGGPPKPSADVPGKMPSFRPCQWPNQTDTAETGDPMVLLKGGEVYTPAYLGTRHVLVGGGRILKLFDDGPQAQKEIAALIGTRLVTVVDISGSLVVPGFVDIHVHVTGGGGESGPESKVPESRLSELFKGGLTTVVGVLGTDSVTRTAAELLTKVNALNRSPLTAFMWTGAYKVSCQRPLPASSHSCCSAPHEPTTPTARPFHAPRCCQRSQRWRARWRGI
jgi:hypothetical protein